MRINTLDIHSFRLFKDISIKLGTRITVITGTNAVGKSTILGLLGNSSELKKKCGAPILKPQFRCEFSEIFKLSEEFDPTHPKVATVTFDDNKELYYRISWQKGASKESKRGRLIPNSIINGKKTNAKNSWPVLYLGLSRLYPLGEAILSSQKSKPVKISSELLTKYSSILSLYESILSTNEVHFTDIKKKVSFGVNTNTYNYISNSAGQDNLGQILLSVESFKKLKERRGDSYNGGLLLIDELDAALHPSAQVKLFEYLYKESKDLSLQVVFTTHSTSLLKHAIKKRDEVTHPTTPFPPIMVHYFSRANGDDMPLKHYDAPSFDKVKSLLNESVITLTKPKIKVISEDAEARWLITNLVPENYVSKIDILDTTIGCNEVLSLAKCDRSFFNTRLIIIDGDIRNQTSKIKEIELLNSQKSHIVVLPTLHSIENSLLKFLTGSSKYVQEYYNSDLADNFGLTKAIFMSESTSIQEKTNNTPERELLKSWLNKYLDLFKETHLLSYWQLEHKEEVEIFIQEFTKAVDELY